ncbi:MAG: LPXTG cell wall anchor domain-containing protein [Lachnospiraceae bacterium]|nr:LPXTG cell wall anchor domain-containing protein [Lachnospiraceae bacterium]
MKKILTAVLVLVMVLSSVNCAFAALTSYSKSPTLQQTPDIKKIELISEGEDAPEIIIQRQEKGMIQFYTKDDAGKADDGCLVTLKVTPYAEKKTISEVVCKVNDGTSATGKVSAEDRLVYAITNPKNGTDGMGADGFKLWRDIINNAADGNLEGAAEAKAKIKNKDLVIVSVFDVSVWCEKPEQHDLSQHHCIHTIRLSFGDDEMSSLLNNYVSLMHYNRDGQWEYIPSRLYEDPATKEDIVEFQIDCENLSPFAIAAFSSQEGSGAPTSPQTGDTAKTGYLCGAMLSLALAAVFFVIGRRKENK